MMVSDHANIKRPTRKLEAKRGFEVLTAMGMAEVLVRVVTPCELVRRCKRFEDT
jgi:hypothetical protein